MAGAGALRSTAADLVTFGQALLEPDKTPLAAAIKGMMKAHAPYDGQEIGLGIMIDTLDGHREYSHGGGTGGYRSALQVIPDLKTIRVALSNNTSAEPGSLFSKTREEKPSDAPEQKLTAAELDAFTGVFESGPQARFTVIRREHHLQVRLTGQPFLPVKCIGKDRFRYDAVVAELRFNRENDAVTSLVLHQNGREVPAKRSGNAPHLEFPAPEELDAYAGQYALFPGKILTITRRDETLLAQLTDQPAMPVFATKADYFEYDVVTAALEFQRDKSGTVTGLILHQNGKHAAKKR
jgi:hypothetical protein